MSAFNLLIIFFCLPAFLVLIRNILVAVYLWQVKEFRLDRVVSHFYSEHADTRLKHVFSYVKIGMFTALVMYLISPYAVSLLVVMPVLFLIYVSEGLAFVEEVIGRKFLRPRIKSVRNLLISVMSFLLLILPLVLLLVWANSLPLPEDTLYRGFLVKNSSSNLDLTELLPREEGGVLVAPFVVLVLILASLMLVVIDALSFTVVSLMVFATAPLASLRRRLLVNKAAAIIKQHPDLKIIGITGSYGKTTTKELIYQLLQSRFKVVETAKNNNTDVGIALTIIKEVKDTSEVFVAEMGAYTKGEVARSATLAPPDIAIVTGIDEQHLALFGSIENIIQAKYEIVEHMKTDGLAIFNGNNEYCLRMAEKTGKRKKIFFSIQGDEQIMTQTIEPPKADIAKTSKTQFPINENIYAKNIVLTKTGIAFELQFSGEIFKVSTNFKAKYYIMNLLAAIVAANELGLPIEEIVAMVNKTKFDLPYLNIYPGLNKSKIIDDGYNVNQKGMLSALDFLAEQRTQGKKWLLTQGILELGEAKDKIYKEIAKKITSVADGLITTDKILLQAVRAEKSDFVCVLVDVPARFTLFFEKYIGKGDLVLIEGALPKLVLDQIYTPAN